MPISFTKIPQASLNPKTGEVSGISKKQEAPNIGMDTKEFHNQVIQLVNSKVPIEKANQAIDSHSEITNKPLAKSMASSVYEIMGSK